MVTFSMIVYDASGVPKTGLTPTIKIRRKSDSYYWNGGTSTWQAGSVANNMSELSDGIYYYDFSGEIQDIFVIMNESTIPRYARAFYAIDDLVGRIDGLNRKITDVVLNADGSIASCNWEFSATSSFGSPVATWALTYTYDADGKLTDVEVVKQ